MKAPSPWADRWQTVRLGHLLAPSIQTGEPDLDVLSVYRDYGVIRKDSRSDNFNRTPADLSRYQVVNPGDVVVNRMKAWQGSLGISAFQGLVSPDYDVLRPTTNQWDTRFLHHVLRSRPMIDEYAVRSTGIRPSQWRLYWAQMRTIPVPVPTLGEQRAIANYLERETARIDTLIQEQQRLVEMLRERRSAVVDAALQPRSDWTKTILKFLLDGVDQGVSPQAEAGLADEPGSWGVLKSGCVNRGVFRQDEHKLLEASFSVETQIAVAAGDLIVSRASGSPDLVGSAAIVDRLDYNLILSDKLFRLRLRTGHWPRFLYWFLNSGHYRIQVRGAISGAEGLANNLPLSALRAFAVVVPPFDEQLRIVAYLDEQTASIDELIAETERFIELSRERRSALITAAVTGRIDVRGEVA